jgi:signal transduction histidine kinase
VATRAAEAAAAGHGGRLVLDSAGPVAVAVDETTLRRALGNLLDNAFRAAGPTGTVRLRVGTDDHGAFASIDDDGPGFGRVGSGSRLGLSIVAEMAVSAGGCLEIGRSELGGARVSVRLPVSGVAPTGGASR